MIVLYLYSNCPLIVLYTFPEGCTCMYMYICRVKKGMQKYVWAYRVGWSSFPNRADLQDRTASPRSAAGPGSYRRPASVEHPACIMLKRWHHSSVSDSTQVQLAPQSSKLGSWLEIHIQGYCTAEPRDWRLRKDGTNWHGLMLSMRCLNSGTRRHR